jgi:uncharacterized protein with PQ loop repeat
MLPNLVLSMQMLGVGILTGACVTKLPQVLNVVQSRSVEGLSVLSIELELYVGLIHVCYGVFNKLAITAYGEAALMWIQNLVLLAIVYLLRRVSPARPALVLTVITLVVIPVALDQVDKEMMEHLYDMNSTIYLCSKLPQILMAFRQVRASGCCRQTRSHRHHAADTAIKASVIRTDRQCTSHKTGSSGPVPTNRQACACGCVTEQ